MSEESGFWIEEFTGDYFSMRYKAKNRLFSKKSKFQQIDIVDTEAFGRMLLNDGLVMISERDEFTYHEMISHVPLFSHPDPKKVLIIGGGDGGTAREVIKHDNIESCTMVEIDEVVVEGCKKFIPQTAGNLENPKLNLIIEDGVKFIAKTREKFDVVIVDSTDPIGPATPLFGEEFYSNVKKILGEDGIIVAQGESPFYEATMQKTMLGILNKFFEKVHIYNFNNLTYPGGLWSFWYASNVICPLSSFKPERVKNSGIKFSYYNDKIHRASFVLPEFMKENLKDFLTPFDESCF